MKSKLLIPIASCFALLHSPDGVELRVDINQIATVRPNIAEHTQRHLAHGIGSILSVGGQKFGVVESPDEIQDAIHHCLDGDGK